MRTVSRLAAELRRLTPPAGLRPAFERMLAGLDRLVVAIEAQTAAAVSGKRPRLISATRELEHVFDVQHGSAADMNAFACALSLERWAKTLR